jgi:hypothetical protein
MLRRWLDLLLPGLLLLLVVTLQITDPRLFSGPALPKSR